MFCWVEVQVRSWQASCGFAVVVSAIFIAGCLRVPQGMQTPAFPFQGLILSSLLDSCYLNFPSFQWTIQDSTELYIYIYTLLAERALGDFDAKASAVWHSRRCLNFLVGSGVQVPVSIWWTVPAHTNMEMIYTKSDSSEKKHIKKSICMRGHEKHSESTDILKNNRTGERARP